jgi:hypothetical protein
MQPFNGSVDVSRTVIYFPAGHETKDNQPTRVGAPGSFSRHLCYTASDNLLVGNASSEQYSHPF